VSFYFGKADAVYTGEGRAPGKAFWIWNLFAWLAGFVVYQVAVRLDSVPLGPTLLAVIVSAALAYARVLVKR
jgi:uncharacterized membrane protein YhaH (DUF805 family)